MIRNFSNTISLINLAMQQKKPHIILKQIDANLIKVFYRFGIVSNVSKLKGGFQIKIRQPIVSKLRVKSYLKKNNLIFISPQQMLATKLNFKGNIFIFSTHRGLKTQNEMIQENLSGFLVCKLFLK